jgi:anthranilate 1,2-dioxygenase ferredoxin reductase subunit
MANDTNYDLLIVGAGHAGRNAARSARAANPALSIALIGEEAHLPYERPALSKAALADDVTNIAPDTAENDENARYGREGIALFLKTAVCAIDPARRQVRTDDGRTLTFGKAILATGSRVKKLPVALTREVAPDRLFYLRTKDDAERLRNAMTHVQRHAVGAKPAHVVVIGAGFIGLEVACAARERGLAATVVDHGSRILGRVFPETASAPLAAVHRARGVALRLQTAISAMTSGADGRIAVDTSGGRLIADLVVVGIGVDANVSLAQDAGLQVDNGIAVDAFGRTDHPDIFAAGEVCRHPTFGYDTPQRLESWQVAEMQANAVGATAAGVATAYDAIPWFWSDQFGVNIQCLGNVGDAAQTVTRGDPAGAHSLFFLNAAQHITGLIAFNTGKDVSAARRIMRAGTAVDPALLADSTVPWRTLMAQ